MADEPDEAQEAEEIGRGGYALLKQSLEYSQEAERLWTPAMIGAAMLVFNHYAPMMGPPFTGLLAKSLTALVVTAIHNRDALRLLAKAFESEPPPPEPFSGPSGPSGPSPTPAVPPDRTDLVDTMIG